MVSRRSARGGWKMKIAAGSRARVPRIASSSRFLDSSEISYRKKETPQNKSIAHTTPRRPPGSLAPPRAQLMVLGAFEAAGSRPPSPPSLSLSLPNAPGPGSSSPDPGAGSPLAGAARAPAAWRLLCRPERPRAELFVRAGERAGDP